MLLALKGEAVLNPNSVLIGWWTGAQGIRKLHLSFFFFPAREVVSHTALHACDSNRIHFSVYFLHFGYMCASSRKQDRLLCSLLLLKSWCRLSSNTVQTAVSGKSSHGFAILSVPKPGSGM